MLPHLLLAFWLGGSEKIAEIGDSYQFTISFDKTTVSGKFQKGLPTFFRADGIDFFRQGDKLIYKDAGAWHKTRTGTLSDPLRILGPSAKVCSARLPHEELQALRKVWTDTAVKEAKDEKLISGKLSEAAAKELARTETHGVARGGSAQIWQDAKGRVIKYEFAIRLEGKLGDAEVDGMEIKRVTIDGVGSTKVDLPEEAKPLLK